MSVIGTATTEVSEKGSAMDTPEEFHKASKILDESSNILEARGRQYGDPATMHLRISHLWTTYLERYISPEQVAGCMALLKIARSMESPKLLDSYIDAACYLAISGELATMDWDNYGNY